MLSFVKNKPVLSILVGFFALSLVACGSAGTDSSASPASSIESAASAVASLFGGASASSSLIKATSHGEDEGSGETCESLNYEDDLDIIDGAYGDPGTYGAASSSVTVAAEDFCEMPDGTENSGLGPDGEGLFATFELGIDIEGDCVMEDGATETVRMQTGSSGIWRNTEVYEPQIFGNFTFLDDAGEEIVLDCTIYLGTGEEVVSADCADESGEAVVQDEAADCDFENAEETE